MKVFTKNLEILLLNHDLVMVPGLGGFLANYSQADINDECENNNQALALPPSRNIVFNKDLNANDGLMIHAYMQNYDATYPQAFKQLEVDVQKIKDELTVNGFVIFENIGTLHLNIDGNYSFEQIHDSLVTPTLFALPPLSIYTVAQLENKEEINNAIRQISELQVESKPDRIIKRKRIWKDVAISSAAAITLFFMFAFPYVNNSGNNEKIVAGPNETNIHVVDNPTIHNNDNNVNEYNASNNRQNTSAQIILLQPNTQSNNTVVISTNDLNNAKPLNSQDGDFTIVVTAAANESCAMSVINKLNKDNIPGAYYHEGNDGKFVCYSRFNSVEDAVSTIKALKNVNKRFKKAWVKKITN